MRHFHTLFALVYCVVVSLAVVVMVLLQVGQPPAALTVLFFVSSAGVFIPMKMVFTDREFYSLGLSMLYYVAAAASAGGLYYLVCPQKSTDLPLVAVILAFFLYYLPARAIMRRDGG
ncbi:hypothetical protein IV102_22810 [bacterium]|nr:hypothetical protein [bacterium]